jgi:hypothetical protein
VWLNSETFFDLSGKAERLNALEAKQALPGFWADAEAARHVLLAACRPDERAHENDIDGRYRGYIVPATDAPEHVVVEAESKTTADEARILSQSSALLGSPIVLVTSPTHMSRALAVFRAAVRGERDDRAVVAIGAERARRLVARHLGHLGVEQHDVERCTRQGGAHRLRVRLANLRDPLGALGRVLRPIERLRPQPAGDPGFSRR